MIAYFVPQALALFGTKVLISQPNRNLLITSIFNSKLFTENVELSSLVTYLQACMLPGFFLKKPIILPKQVSEVRG
jgi:hypothetical protein